MARMQNLALKGPMPAPRYTGETNDYAQAMSIRSAALGYHSAMSEFELGMAGSHAAEDHGGSRYWFVRDRLYFSMCQVGERISYAAY